MKYFLLTLIFLVGCATTNEEECAKDKPPKWCDINLYRDQRK